MRYTAASSLVSMPTIRSDGIRPRPPDLVMICSSTAGASLQPHPPPWERLVSRTAVSVSFTVSIVYGGIGSILGASLLTSVRVLYRSVHDDQGELRGTARITI